MRKNGVALGPSSLNRTRTGAKPIPVAPASRAANAKRDSEESKVGRVEWQGLIGRLKRADAGGRTYFFAARRVTADVMARTPVVMVGVGWGSEKVRCTGGR